MADQPHHLPSAVAIAIHSLAGGGAERTAARLADHWAEAGLQTTLITLDAADRDLYPISDRIRRVGLGLMKSAGSRWNAVGNNLQRLAAVRQAVRASPQAEHVVSLTDKMNVVTLLACLRTRWRVIICERTDPRRHQIGPVWSFLRRRVYRHAAALVVQTEGVRSWSRELMHGRPVHVVPNAAFPVSEPVSAKPSSDPSVRRIVGLGRLADHKGFDLLVSAFAQIAPKHPQWILEIHGEGDQRANLEDFRRQHSLDERIRLPGWNRQPSDALRGADIFVLPSRYEGFPNALLEAMARGLPCVSFACDSGPAEIIRHNVDGLLVPPQDVGALAAALDQLIQDPSQRQRLGNQAREVLTRFSETRHFRLWDAILAGESEAAVDQLGGTGS